MRDLADEAAPPHLDADALWRAGRRRWAAITTSVAGTAAVATLIPLAVLGASSNPAPGPEPASSQALDWTKQAPAAAPSAREAAALAYDAATRTAVLFGGGYNGRQFGDIWTWNGTTWTRQHPAASPPALEGAAMAYDPATHTAVLFGGFGVGGPFFADTWTWGDPAPPGTG